MEHRIAGMAVPWFLISLLIWEAPHAHAEPGRVVLNEIHYNPAGGKLLEFVELHNPGTAAVDLGGWVLRRGIRHEFEPNTVIDTGGYLVVCRDPGILARHHGLAETALRAWVSSGLDNGGEEIVLVDSTGAMVDRVHYDDSPPWPVEADGNGPSLQRLCVEADSNQPTNWSARPDDTPTPLAGNHSVICPPPELPPPVVAINEIHYHPHNDLDETLEYVELVNTAAEPVDLGGHCFSAGIQFCFDVGIVLPPGGHVVVCRDQNAVRDFFRITNTVGDFIGQLSNAGERLTLVDPTNGLVDSVRYADSEDWPVGADGLGYSLEKITSTALSDDPASWSDSGSAYVEGSAGSPDWQTGTATGPATSSRLYFYLDEVGEFLIDNVSLVALDSPDVNLIPDGTFDVGLGNWETVGNHSNSRWSQALGGTRFDEPALHLIADGQGSGSSHSVAIYTIENLDRSSDTIYSLTFSYVHLAGSHGLSARLSLATPGNGVYFRHGSGRELGVVSPGTTNIVATAAIPPFVSHVNRSPRQPGSSDATVITAAVRGTPVLVTLHADLPGGARELEMRDDGLSGDTTPGDGVFATTIPPQPHNTAVTFTITAASAAGTRISPPPTDPMRVHGFYVNDNRPRSRLPIYTLILPTADPGGWLARLDCSLYRYCSVAIDGDLYHDVSIRARGGSVCGNPDIPKTFFKIRFHRGHEFKNQRKLNFQSLWTDKSLVRERLAWQVFDEMANPYARLEHVRLHANGGYLGLYVSLEHPDRRFVERNGLDPDGNLYKALISREEPDGLYEEETNKDGDMTDLRDFLSAMHQSAPNDLVAFFQKNVDADVVIDYQASQVLINNRDYAPKNHFLFHDLADGKWIPVAWDLDLSYGKYWAADFLGVLNDGMDVPGINPWYTTTVRGGSVGNHLLDKFFNQSGDYFRRAYLVRLWSALHEKFTLESYRGRIRDLRTLLFEEQREDIAAWGRSPPTANDPAAPAEFVPNLDRVMEHIALRHEYLIDFMEGTERFHGHDRLMITEIMYNPAGTDDAEFIELWNNSGRGVDLSGWSIDGIGGSVGSTGKIFVFPAGSAVKADEIIIVARDPAVFEGLHDSVGQVFGPYTGSLDNDGEVLRVRDAGAGFPATVDRIAYDTRAPWNLRPDGFGPSLELVGIHADLDNENPDHWRDSTSDGGSPGEILLLGDDLPHYRRGNCNTDARIDISDAAAILLYLFRGQVDPPCLDGCDVNGDRSVAIDDAIALLQHLFTARGFPIPFPNPRDCAPAQEGACATSNCSP